ncbi:SDR family NAD(P)-dependent oxidoreductase [Acidicapsa ligni]|uniref:SDR family NAD(P)-dependent oxidoreductase n=1 Tax=Acidicapsa ligni TaxID=542300 RepID=UPI0021DFFF11|nr:SDR family oxidoreductase [Acidicapsa ligni]
MGTALITGASSGIGAAYADRLARRGYNLILVARDHDKLNAMARIIRQQTGRIVRVMAADLTEPYDLACVEEMLRSDPEITMLVNNAGIGSTQPLLQSKADQMEKIISLNVTALTRLTYAVVPVFVERGSGIVINISSIVAVAPEILNGVYGGTKAFVLAFSQSLRHELAETGVRIQVVLPGGTQTGFFATAGTPIHEMTEERRATLMTTDDVVDAALAGLDLGEFATLPSLANIEEWNAFESARKKMIPSLRNASPANRYKAVREQR